MDTEASPRKVPHAIDVMVRSITYLGADINAYEVVPATDSALPAFGAGSHIDLYFRDGRVRQYSLCNDPSERHRYVFAVQREPEGRGGSKAIFELIHVGRVLRISPPRNNFSLALDAQHHLLIAGGIGVTPIYAMALHLKRMNASFELHYTVRSKSKSAFFDELRSLDGGNGRIHLYIDEGDPSKGIDISALAEKARPQTHVYCCGPEGLMRAVENAFLNARSVHTHFERFAAPDTKEVLDKRHTDAPPDAKALCIGFQIHLARSNRVFDVPDDKSIVEVLRENGIDVPTSCEAGLCGTCKVKYLDGQPDHRDYVLDDGARRTHVLICCARSKTPSLVLDL